MEVILSETNVLYFPAYKPCFRLFGPRRKMTNAIARWHSNARPSGNDLEQAYADKLEADMQEMAIQLKLVC